MAINFNVNPYFDDYDEDKGFHRILFKPGVAVQARELTQLQTIMQKQVERMGRHFFEDGAMVIPGQIAIDVKVKSVKLTTASVGSTNLSTLFDGENKIIEGLTTGVEALVLLGVNEEGGDAPTLIVRFTKNGTDTTTTQFSTSETIRIKNTSTTFVTDATQAVFPSSIASIQEGVFFAGNNFIKVLAQTIPLDKYTDTPSYRVGLSLSESIVTEIDDTSLNDNAIGSPNESAPGADRYKIQLILSKLVFTSELDQDFFELVRVENGVILKIVNKTQYSVLEKTLARRTFDESGNYTVSPFRIQIREHRNNNRGAWQTSTAYKAGDIVTSSGNTYVALTTSTSAVAPTHGFGVQTDGTLQWLLTKNPRYNQGIYTPLQGGDDTKLAIGIEPGKAYINGYEIEKISTQYTSIPKARDTRTITSEEIDSVVGNHVLVSNVYIATTTDFNIASFSTVKLYDDVTATAGTAAGNIVGTASVRGMYYDSGNASQANAIFKLSLFNISMNDGKTLERNVKQFANTNFTADIAGFNSDYKLLEGTVSVSTTTLTGQGTEFTTEFVPGDYIYIDATKELRRIQSITNDYSATITSGTSTTASKYYRAEITLREPENVPALFEMPYSLIKSVSNPIYYTLKPLYNQTNGSGQFVVTGNAINTAAALSDYVIINRDTGRTYSGTSISYPSSTAFTISGLTNSQNYTVLAPILDTTGAKTKTPSSESLLITNNVLYSATEISLNKVDVYAVDGIYMIESTGNADITSWYDLDTGQRSSHYGISKIIRKPQFPKPSSSIRIDFRYFSHTGSASYFDATSYSQIPYEDVPVFYGDKFSIRLSDVLDFRPVANVNNVNNFLTSYLPHRNFKTTIDYEHYLSRNDKISMDLRGNIFSTQGASAVITQDPADPANGMTLYKIKLSPYTLSPTPPSVTYDYIDNKRFTMRDIGDLEKRIQHVEYYTNLSLLEQDTASLSIRDPLGLERFKNGFIVDNFEGHGIGDVNSPDYICSIDMENNELRPFYTMENINLIERDSTSRSTNGYQITGDMVTLKYTDAVLVNQSYASRLENINPFAVASFMGRMQLNPPGDEWFETEVRPEIVINEEGNFDAVRTTLDSAGALGTVWNAWQTQWTGVPQLTGATRTEVAILQTGQGTDFDQRFGVGRQVNPWAGPGAGQGVGVRAVTLQTATTQQGRARTGVRTSVVARIDRRIIDDRIISTATIPFIRARDVAFVGRGLKPNTRLFSFFDDVDVSAYVRPAANVAITPISGTFTHEASAEAYAEEAARAPRRTNNNPNAAFNKGDIVYVSNRGGTPYNVDTTVGSGILGYFGSANVMYLHNIKGTMLASDTVTGTISGATGTLGANVSLPALGSALSTNSNGDVAGVFSIPNTPATRFRTGSREFVLTDSSTNNRILANTQGRVNYTASGILQTRQATVAATRNAEVVRDTITQTDTISVTSENITNDTGWYDPLAQTFLVDVKNGCFLTKVDIFFSSKDATLPVTLDIRTTVNGYPGRRILPFSSVTLYPNQVLTSADASVATTFTFKSPVYVEESAEYCIVLTSDSVEYKVWISQLGDDAIGTDRRISQQPYAGVLFKSQNASTWTADQLQDLKFKLYRAQFDISQVGNFSLINETLPTKVLPYDSLKFTQNSSIVKVLHPMHGMPSGSNVTLSGFDGGYNIPSGNINKKHTIGNVLTDSYTITVGNVASQTVTTGKGNIVVTEDIVLNVIQPIVQFRNFTGTDVTFKANTAAATFFTSRGSSPVTVLANENNYFSTPRAIKSNDNETATTGEGRKSFELRALMTSTLENLSPVIDINRTSLIGISNKIDYNNATTSNFAHDNNVILSGNTKIRFFGNTISTNEGVTANILSSLTVGKTLSILNVGGNATNNANVVISKVTNTGTGVANVELYYTFVNENPGNVITLTQREGYVDERAYAGGSSVAKYITRQINLANPSKFLRIMFAHNTPKEAEIDVYYRILPNGSLESLNTQNFVLIRPSEALVKTENPGEFYDAEYEGDNLLQFSALAVKIVFRSTNSSQVPSVKDLRIITCP